MKKIISCLLCLMSIAFWGGCTSDEELLNGTIAGFVTDNVNANTPIAGATVTLSTKGLNKTTGSDGRFEFKDLEPGTYTLQVSANEYQTTTKQVTVYAGQAANCDFQLSKSKVVVSITPLTLRFGSSTEQLSFTIKNFSARASSYTISNIPDFVQVSPITGSLEAKGQQSVVVSVINRSNITTQRNGQMAVNIGNDSYAISINVEPFQKDAISVDINPQALAFGSSTEQLSFIITNNGTKNLNYTISNIPDFVQVSPPTGLLAAKSMQSVVVSVINRASITTQRNGQMIISIGSDSYTISVNVEPYQEEVVNVDINPQTLNFNKDIEQLKLMMTSNYSKPLDYTITSNLDIISVSPESGTLTAHGKSEINVTVNNRKNVTANRTGMLTIQMGGNTYIVNIGVEKYEEEINPDPIDTDVLNGLFAYFTFENTTRDITEQELNGVGIETSYVSSYNGTKALNIPANSSSMLSVSNSLVDQRKMSISFWAKDLHDGHIFHAVRSYDNKPAFLLAMIDGRLKFVATRYHIGYKFNSCPSFTHGSLSGWHMITLVSDFNITTYAQITTKLYIDGAFVDTVTESDNPYGEAETGDKKNYNACVKFIMGGETNESYTPTLNATKIVVDNMRVYRSRNLTDTEIKTIYNAEKY